MFLLSIANAEININDFTIIANIEANDYVVMDCTITLDTTENLTEIRVPIFLEPDGLIVHDKNTFLEYDSSFSDGNIIIKKGIKIGEKISLDVRLIYTSIINVEHGKNFLIDYDLPNNTKHFELIVKLPESYVLSGEAHPEPTSITSDGRRIIMDWNVDAPGDSFVVTFDYEKTMTSDNTILILLIVIIVLIAFSAFIFLKFRRVKKQEQRIIAVGLSPDEKKIYELIKSKGELKQKEVQHTLEISKPRLSKLIRRLVEQELIEVKPFGRTNIVKLKK